MEVWSQSVLEALQERNRRERSVFEEIILTNGRYQSRVNSLRQENTQLTIQNEQLKTENTELKSKAPLGEGVPADIQQKLFSLQEELRITLKTKGDNAQQVIDLRNEVEKKDRELKEKDSRIEELSASISDLKHQLTVIQEILEMKEKALECIHDEHSTLQLSFNILDEKKSNLSEEYNNLLERFLALKNREASFMNQEAENFVIRKQEKIHRDLQEAVKEEIVIEEPLEEPVQSIISLVPQRLVTKFVAHEGEVHAVQWSHSGRFLATGGADRNVRLWDFDGREVHLRNSLTGSNMTITSLAFDSEDQFLLAASNDYSARVWTISDQRLRNTLTGHSDRVMAAKFYEGAKSVVTASRDRTLKLWDLRRDGCLRTLFCNSTATDVITSDDSASTVISSHFDKKIRFWDIRTGSTEPTIGYFDEKITSLDLSNDHSSILCCMRNNSLNIFDVRKHDISLTFRDDDFVVGSDWTRAKFSSDANHIVAGGADGTIFVWDAKTAELVVKLKELTATVICTSWSPNGDYILSSDRDRKVCVWGP